MQQRPSLRYIQLQSNNNEQPEATRHTASALVWRDDGPNQVSPNDIDMIGELSWRVQQAIWFVLPVGIAGLLHVAVMKLDLLPALGRLPLDGGLRLRGRRVFGDNKTVRGALVMSIATPLIASLLSAGFGVLAERLAVAPFQVDHPAVWGLLLGAGYWIGELPNSLAKRQLDIAPGDLAAGARGVFFWFVDQLDSIAGVFVALSVVWRPDFGFVALVAAITLVLHPLMAALMVTLRLKHRIG